MFDVASIDATEGSRGPTRRAVVPPVRHRNGMAPVVVDSFPGSSKSARDPQQKPPQDAPRFERIAATATHPTARATRTRTMMSPIGMHFSLSKALF